jgi:3-deoxy-D-manno-octulosonic-acid transferase
LALLSARMTEDSAVGWARAPASARAVLGAFELVLAQDAATEDRLRRLGASPGPRLNLKLVGDPPPFDEAELGQLRAATGGRKVVLAASTHPGEEPVIAQAFCEAAADGALLVVAPRHPDRGPAVAANLASAGFQVGRRSLGEAITPQTGAYVVDTLGELGLFLRLADIAVMGGSLVEGIGGHNPLEPAWLGVPIVTGPQVFNARDVYDEMFAEAAAIEAADPAALARHLRGLLAQPMVARRIGEAALSYAERQGAALEAALTLIEPLLPA